MEQHTLEATSRFVSPEERAHLVRLCAAITGDRAVAEDLAQETLLEAWRHKHALRDQAQRAPWLSAIARNVCLRWRRKHWRDAAHLVQPNVSRAMDDAQLADLEDVLAEDLDIEVELERKELVELLDRALALLPPESRAILIQCYVEESPLADVAARLGSNAHAVSMRLQRGKLALRRVLTTTMRHEIAPYHLPIFTDVWEDTPLWCSYCGQYRLLGKRTLAEGALLLKCPACSPGADEALSVNRIPQLQGVKGYKPLLSRLRAWCDHYYRTGLANGFVVCETCGQSMPVSISLFEDLPDWVHEAKDSPRCAWRNNDRPVSILCTSCHTSRMISLAGLVLSLPESKRFLQTSPRIRALPIQQVEVDARPALVTHFESVTDNTTLTVVSAYDTYEVLRIYRGG